jgi:spore maturation protein CgeB
MRIALFYHSLVSDWNHGNAHFLRGVATELIASGHEVRIYEPADGWSFSNLRREHGEAPIRAFHAAYPGLASRFYALDTLDLERELADVDLAIVHEWNDHELVRRVGQYRARNRDLRLLFHDTHHRSVTDPAGMAAYDLGHYDGVLAYGEAIRAIYLGNGWTQRAWTWHEAADTRIFRPLPSAAKRGGVVWIGNWGDEERTAELHEFLLDPVRALGVEARLYGVRYPRPALEALDRGGIDFGGWLPNYRVPEVFAAYRVTVHIPRRPYAEALPGIPTIRPFEAMACGIPLISAPWRDIEGLFRAGEDYLVARSGKDMEGHLTAVLNDDALAAALARNGRKRILERHTCAHRAKELIHIYGEIAPV